MNHKRFIESQPVKQQQRGYIMLIVAVFLLVLLSGSAQFFSRIANDTQTSGMVRDSTESLMLAETAMELLRGRYISTLDTVVEAPDVLDHVQAGQLPSIKANPDAGLFPYMYYVSAGTGIDQDSPSILQKIANGEAVATTAAAMTARSINSATSQMRVNDLFATVGATDLSPMLYTRSDNGLLVTSVAVNWAAEASSEKVAVWVEVIENDSDANAIDIFVQAVAQVGNAKSYVQRYVGTYNNILGTISALAEASNIDRTGM